MEQQDFVQVAADIARRAHDGQVDKAGAAAWLHDVLEDCDVDAAELAAAGIPQDVIDAVQALTKRAGEDLQAYCSRVLANPTALRVKRADIEDNTDPARTGLLPDEMRIRLATKYARARSLLDLPEPV